MKKSTLINSELSYLVATMGHTDEITVCDAGLPVPVPDQRLDLAIARTAESLLTPMKFSRLALFFNHAHF